MLVASILADALLQFDLVDLLVEPLEVFVEQLQELLRRQRLVFLVESLSEPGKLLAQDIRLCCIAQLRLLPVADPARKQGSQGEQRAGQCRSDSLTFSSFYRETLSSVNSDVYISGYPSLRSAGRIFSIKFIAHRYFIVLLTILSGLQIDWISLKQEIEGNRNARADSVGTIDFASLDDSYKRSGLLKTRQFLTYKFNNTH